MCPPMREHWRHLANTTELVLPSAHQSPQPKRQIDRFSHFCTAHGSVAGHIGATWRIWLHLCFLVPTQVDNPNGKSIGAAVFALLMAESPYTLQWALLSPKIAPTHGGSGPPSNTWFPGPTWVLSPNGISISSAVFARLTSELDRPTDHATRSVTIGRIYLHSTVMWLKN